MYSIRAYNRYPRTTIVGYWAYKVSAGGIFIIVTIISNITNK